MSMSRAFYNENDPKAAAWLRELIAQGHIAPGVVDERSISDLTPDELNGYTQCHFFAGIGGWSLALRLAGWPDELPAWTGSCPCQPFSAAGKGAGIADERHLWPDFKWLIDKCRPAIVFGEQVASKAGREWLAGVFADLEAMEYQRAGADLCAPSVGAPHIRQRLWWMAYAQHSIWGSVRRSIQTQRDGQNGRRTEAHGVLGTCGEVLRLALAETSRFDRSLGNGDSSGRRRLEDYCATRGMAVADGGHSSEERQQRSGEQRQQPENSSACGMEHAAGDGREQRWPEPNGRSLAIGCGIGRMEHSERSGLPGESFSVLGPSNQGHWSRCDIIECLDGKARRIESGTFPLAHGIPGRVGLLRGYGNAIVPQVAAQFVTAAMEAIANAGGER